MLRTFTCAADLWGFLVVKFLLVLSVVNFVLAGFFGLQETETLILTGLEKGRKLIGLRNQCTVVIR